jgi:hypothetical protein
MLTVTCENRLPVVKDQSKVEILKGAKLKKEPVFFLEAKLLPLIRIYLLHKTTARVIRNFLQKR